jgi:hypothetical protein
MLESGKRGFNLLVKLIEEKKLHGLESQEDMKIKASEFKSLHLIFELEISQSFFGKTDSVDVSKWNSIPKM